MIIAILFNLDDVYVRKESERRLERRKQEQERNTTNGS